MKHKGRGKRKSLSRADKIEIIRLITAMLVLIKAIFDLFVN